MKNIYYSRSAGAVLRLSGMILGVLLLFQTVLAAAAGAPVAEEQRFSVQENALNGMEIGMIEAVGAVSFQLTGGNDLGAFALDELTGVLTVSDSTFLDYEMHQSFSLTVQVTGLDNLASEVTAVIEVQNVDKPAPVTGESTNITEKSASLAGSFETGGAATVAAIQYGLEAQLPEFDPEGADGSVPAAPGAVGNTLELDVTDLQDGTTYYYRTVAKNSEGVVYGQRKSFTTFSIPWVNEIVIRDPNPTSAEMVTFLVTFTEPVNGVDVNDFVLNLDPTLANGSLNGDIVTVDADASGVGYIVTVDGVSGDGTLRLDFVDNGTVESVNGVNIGGAGPDNGAFADGEVYTIDNTNPGVLTLIYTNEDVSARHFFAVTNDPDKPEDLRIDFNSSKPNIVREDYYEITRNGSRWEVRMFPVEHAYGESTVTINVVDGADNASPTIELLVVVRAVADKPLLVANNVEGDEDTAIPLDVAASLVDQDGSESFESIAITGLPVGATLNAGTPIGDGTTFKFTNPADLQSITFTPPANASGIYELTLSATTVEEATGDDVIRKRESDSKTFTVTVNAVNDAPAFALDPESKTLLEDFETEEYVAINPAEVPADERDQVVNYSVSAKDGKDAIATVVVGQDENGKPRLEITSIKDANGTQVFTVTANDGQGENNFFTQDFTLTISSVNDAPAFALDPESKTLLEDFETEEYVAINPAEVPADEPDQVVNYSISAKDGKDAIATVVVGRMRMENLAWR